MNKNTTALLALLALFTTTQLARAGSATWSPNPATGDWNTPTNWVPTTVPNKRTDTATFDISNITSITVSDVTNVSEVVFNSGASSYTISAQSGTSPVKFTGAGITNNSGLMQNFIAANGISGADKGTFQFTGYSSAGNLTSFTNTDPDSDFIGGVTFFYEHSNGGGANFTNNVGGRTNFSGSASAGNAVVVNNGGHTVLNGNATAGNATFTNVSRVGSPGSTQLQGFATGGNATIINEGSGSSSALGGFTSFLQHSTGGGATYINNGGTATGGKGGTITFSDTTGAGSGIYMNYGGAGAGAGGSVLHFASAGTTMGTATLIAYGGVSGGAGASILVSNATKGDDPRVEVFGNGTFNLEGRQRPLLTIGSLEGDGIVLLGQSVLSIGSNHLDTEFSGVMHDVNLGAVRKVGGGSLTLSGDSDYHAGTTVNGGKLLIKNITGSATGSGPVQVNEGTLSGTGTVLGTVTIGSGTGAGAILSNGSSGVSITIGNPLTFNSDASYTWAMNSNQITAGAVTANGITINSAAQFVGSDTGVSVLPSGTVLTVLSNSSASAIVGTFSNLPDGSNVTIGPNTFHASYEGGDGNDLTLTVL